MRMQSYRMALSIGTGETSALTEQVLEFDGSLAVLHSGDPERPLFVLEPVGQLKQAIEGIQAGEFDARVERVTSDEFGTFARVLTAWQSTCIRCAAIWNERLESLYAVTVLVAA
jgi:nitrate/nitrite-specific signal transduction histidine kinase